MHVKPGLRELNDMRIVELELERIRSNIDVIKGMCESAGYLLTAIASAMFFLFTFRIYDYITYFYLIAGKIML